MRRNRLTSNLLILAGSACAALAPSLSRADTVNTTAFTTAVSIPMVQTQPPASDLVYVKNGHGQILNPDQAWQMEQNQSVDLSKLDPSPTSVYWQEAPTTSDSALDAALPIKAGSTVLYVSDVTTGNNGGRYKMNVELASPGAGGVSTVDLLFAGDLHTYLLKREFMRALGYHIPAMKYLSKISVRFPDAASRDNVLKTTLNQGTNGASASRWEVTPPAGADPLVIIFQDVVALDATPQFDNVAITPPTPGVANPPPQESRVLRALGLIYGLTYIQESLNQTGWSFGEIDSMFFDFTLPMIANFGCGLDDALWILNRIAKFTRADITSIVGRAGFPGPIADVVVEKLLSRRNNLMTVFGTGVPAIPANINISVLPAVSDGVVVQQTWTGYASQFAFADKPSPLDDIWDYVVSLAESNAISAAMAEINNILPALGNANAVLGAPLTASIGQAITNWLQTNVPQAIPLGITVFPVANANINVSRNVVFGNYLGTSDLVQLADTVGVAATAGLNINGSPLPGVVSLTGSLQGNVSISVTHLKPLTSSINGLQQALSTPFINIAVPWLTYQASKALQDASSQQTSSQTPDQIQAAIAADLAQFTSLIGQGESLILTKSLQGTESAGVAVSSVVPLSPGVSLTGSASELVISRIRFYRPAPAPPTYDPMIQVFVDNGDMDGLSLSFQFSLGSPVIFPIVNLSATESKGSATSNVYTVDINSTPASYATFYPKAAALASLLKTGSTAMLEALPPAVQPPPVTIGVDFDDTTTNFQVLWWVNRTLHGNGVMHISVPTTPCPLAGGTGCTSTYSFISKTIGSQSGDNYQSLATEVGAYLLQLLTNTNTFALNLQATPDPGQGLLGDSNTRQVTVQGGLLPALTQPFVQVQYQWEGWNKSATDMQALVDTLNTKYGTTLFPNGFMMDAQSIKLYNLILNINVYQSALNALANADPNAISTLYWKYHASGSCLGTLEVGSVCGNLGDFWDTWSGYKSITDSKKQATALMHMIDDLEQFASFQDFVAILGGTNNIYVSANLSGFRDDSESYSTPMTSQGSIGRQDPTNQNGPLTFVQTALGVDPAEFNMQWIRPFL